jgi:hypothetical protein
MTCQSWQCSASKQVDGSPCDAHKPYSAPTPPDLCNRVDLLAPRHRPQSMWQIYCTGPHNVLGRRLVLSHTKLTAHTPCQLHTLSHALAPTQRSLAATCKRVGNHAQLMGLADLQTRQINLHLVLAQRL